VVVIAEQPTHRPSQVRIRPALYLSFVKGVATGIFFSEHEACGAMTRSHILGIRIQGVTHVKGFRDFITRGNLIDLAVAVVIGAAFTAIVTAIVKDVITPLIGTIWGTHDFSRLDFEYHQNTFAIGELLNAALTFLIIAALVYFLIVVPMAKLMSRIHKDVAVTTRDCPECLSTIPLAASRCMYCTSQVAPITAPRATGPN
jgi:large conductance mechanosensitive channel